VGLTSPTSVDQAQLLGLIGRRLRTSYDELVEQPIPDRLTALVKQLEERLVQTESRHAGRGATDLMISD
jgi:hypothetical protein